MKLDVKYKPVKGLMKDAYPELGILYRHYIEDWKYSKTSADQWLRYFAVLCDKNTPEVTISGREKLAEGVVTIEFVAEIRRVREPRLDDEAYDILRNEYQDMLSAWFKVIHNALLETWFSKKTALATMNQYVRTPLGHDDPDKRAKGVASASESATKLSNELETLEAKLFGNSQELKLVVNEALERSVFAGFPELFAIDRPVRTGGS